MPFVTQKLIPHSLIMVLLVFVALVPASANAENPRAKFGELLLRSVKKDQPSPEPYFPPPSPGITPSGYNTGYGKLGGSRGGGGDVVTTRTIPARREGITPIFNEAAKKRIVPVFNNAANRQ